jgi:retinol-binding protein 3
MRLKSIKIQNHLKSITVISIIVPMLLLFIFFISPTFGQQTVKTGGDSESLNAKRQAVIIDSVTSALNDIYVFPEVAKKMENLLRKNLKKGIYKKITDLPEFTEQLTKDLQAVSKDKHLRVRALPPKPQGESTQPSPEEERKERLKRLQYQNFGFKKVELLPGNIGYIDFRFFADATLGGATAIAAMNFLSHADAIIFDLRQNGGGSPSMIQLMSSYLFEEPVHLNSFYVRKTDETNQFWTQSWVEGPKMVDIPVFVLTSSYTFSGAEEFTYNLKNMKRGTIIGETTGGGAHPVNGRVFEKLNVSMALPFGRAVNPITGTNWEGTGVEPDIKVPAEQALMVARLKAIKNLRKNEQDETKKQQIDWVLKGLEIEKNPVTIDTGVFKAYEGVYGPRKIWQEDGKFYYLREGRQKYELTPMGNDMFLLKDLDYFRIKFKRNKAGAVIEIIGMYDNGRTDSTKRN